MSFWWWRTNAVDKKCRWCNYEVLQPEETRWFERPLLIIGVRSYYCPHCFTSFYRFNSNVLTIWAFISLICLELALALVLPSQIATLALFAIPPTILGGTGYALGRITGLVIGVVFAVVLVGLATPF